MTISFDITTVADDQLDALAPLFPAEVSAEKVRRSSYDSIQEALSALAQVAMDLETVFAQIRLSTAATAVTDTGVLKVIERTLNYAKTNNIEFNAPEVRNIVVEKKTRAPRKPKAEGAEGAEGVEGAEGAEGVEGVEAPKRGRKGKDEQVEAERAA